MEYIFKYIKNYKQKNFSNQTNIHSPKNRTRINSTYHANLHRSSTLGFDLIKSSFGNLTMVVTTWVLMFSSTTLILYPLFQLWTSSRDLGPLGKFSFCGSCCRCYDVDRYGGRGRMSNRKCGDGVGRGCFAV